MRPWKGLGDASLSRNKASAKICRHGATRTSSQAVIPPRPTGGGGARGDERNFHAFLAPLAEAHGRPARLTCGTLV